MRLRLGALAAFLAGALVAADAGADPLTGRLSVARAEGAEVCPTEDSLRAEVEALAGAPILSDARRADVEIDVVLAPAPRRGFRATVSVSGERAGERTLEDVGPGCDVLSRGLAVTLAIVLEAGPGAIAPAPTRAPPGPSPPPTPWWRRYYQLPAIDAPPPVASEDEGIPPLVASIGAVYDTGTLLSDTAGVSLAVDSYIPYASFGVAFVWLPQERVELNRFEVAYAYAAGQVRACVRDPFIEQFGLTACARFSAGRRTANLSSAAPEAGGGDQNHGAYLALGPQLEISRRVVGPLGLYADMALDFPLLQDDLTVVYAAEGNVLDDPERVVSFSMGAGIRFWLEPPVKERPR